MIFQETPLVWNLMFRGMEQSKYAGRVLAPVNTDEHM